MSPRDPLSLYESVRSVVDGDPGALSVAQQANVYAAEVGPDAYDRQIRARRRALGLCVCRKRRLSSNAGIGEYGIPYAISDQATFTWHEPDCARRESWMVIGDAVPRRRTRAQKLAEQAEPEPENVVDLDSRRK